MSKAGVSATVTSLLSPVGTGTGGIAVALTLVFVLAYLHCSAHPGISDRVRRTLLVTALPLATTFAGITVFRAMELL